MNNGTKGIQHLKQKLSNICTAEKFCGICLEIGEKLWSLDTEFDIVVDQEPLKKLLKDVIGFILSDVAHQVLASNYVCSQCTEKSIQSYIFIYNTKQLSKIIYKCVNELYSKTVDIQNQLSEISIDENSNVVIVLEQETESQYTDIGNVIEVIDKETSTPNDDAIKNPIEGESEPNLLSVIESVKDKKVIVETIQPFFNETLLDTDKIDPPNVVVTLTKECSKVKEQTVEEKLAELFGVESSNKTHANSEVLEINDVNIEIMVVDESFDFSELDKTNPAEDKENKNAIFLLPETKNENTNAVFSLTEPKNAQVLSPEIKNENINAIFSLTETKNAQVLLPETKKQNTNAVFSLAETKNAQVLLLETKKENKNAVFSLTETKNAEFLSPETKKKNLDIPPTFKCKICREILPSYKGWKKHFKICRTIKHESSKILFNCKICNEICVTQRTLNTHYKTHSRVRCKVCQFIIPAEDLAEHMKINHDDYTHSCKLCNFFSFNAAGLESHMAKNHTGSKCAFCHKKVSETELKTHRCRFNCIECIENVCIHYKYLISYRDQFLKNGSKVTKCVDCDYVCPRREALLGHVNREHLDHHPFTCAHCSQQFYSRTTLRQHLNQFHKEKHVCEFCDQEFNALSILNNHKEMCKSIERHHKCDHCMSSFATLEELANHVKLRHDKDCFNCNLCKRQFLFATKLQDHTFRVHSGLQMKRKRTALDCPICDVKYATKKELLEHISIHGPGSRFPCKDCEADFDSLNKLHAHKRVHYDDVIQCVECKKVLTTTFFPHHMVYCKPGREDNVEIYTCETCGKTYKSELQLKLHLKTHVDKKPCPICQKPTRPVYMRSHIRYMHSKPKKPKKVKPKIKTKYILKCQLCPHTVSRNGEMESHMNRYHLKVKPYQCNYCNKSFFGKERLRGHLVTHTNNKACLCSVCNMMFQNKACLKLHMRRHTGDLPYACEICGEKFRTSSIMNTHKVKRHSVKTVYCPLCDSMFYLKREMRCHFKKVHWKRKDKKFDPRDVKELDPAFYHLFEDGRLPKVEGEDLCISSKYNEKISE